MLLLQLVVDLIGFFEELSGARMSVDVDGGGKKVNMGMYLFHSTGSQSKTYQAVCRVFLQVDVDALGDLEQPAPLSLQGVHVGLRKSVRHSE